jgi:hypothetical protein
MANALLKRKAKGEQPYFFADPNVDKVIAMVMGLAGEVAVMRDRLDTVERLLETGKQLRRRDIDTYKPDSDVAAERAAWRETFLGEVLRIVEVEREALTENDRVPYSQAIAAVTTDSEVKPSARIASAKPKKATPRKKRAAKARKK